MRESIVRNDGAASHSLRPRREIASSCRVSNRVARVSDVVSSQSVTRCARKSCSEVIEADRASTVAQSSPPPPTPPGVGGVGGLIFPFSFSTLSPLSASSPSTFLHHRPLSSRPFFLFVLSSCLVRLRSGSSQGFVQGP